MLFRETVAVFRENHTEHTDTLRVGRLQSCGMFSPDLTGNTLRLRYKAQPVNVV
jgi:hypothetical protein